LINANLITGRRGQNRAECEKCNEGGDGTVLIGLAVVPPEEEKRKKKQK